VRAGGERLKEEGSMGEDEERDDRGERMMSPN
jgi:hypothetical protein